MKKKLSFLLAVVMILSLLPVMSVSASTTNSSTKQPSVSDSMDWSKYTTTDTTVGGNAIDNPYLAGKLADVVMDAPRLRIKATSDIAEDTQFQIRLNNAEWRLKDPTGATAGNSVTASLSDAIDTISSVLGYNTINPTTIDMLIPNGSSLYGTNNAFGKNGAGSITVARLSDTLVNVTFNGNIFYNDDVVEIPLICEVTSSGEVTASILGSDGSISTGTYTIAFGGSGATKTTIASTSVFPDTLSLKEIMIEETRPGSLNADTPIKLVATAGFEWAPNSKDGITVLGTGGLTGTYYNAVKTLPSSTDNTDGIYWGKYGSNQQDKEVLNISLSGGTTPFVKSSTRSGTIVISGLKLVATDDARYGDANVSISGSGTSGETIKVGEYVKYGISLTAEDKDLPVIVSGDYPESEYSDRIKTLKVIFAEETVKSWYSTRRTTFTLNDGVKMRGVKITSIEKLASTTNVELSVDKSADTAESNKTFGSAEGKAEIAIDDATKLTIRSVEAPSSDNKAKFTMQFFVSVEPGYSGDITLTVGSDGVNEEATAVIAKAITPFTVETASTDVNLGYRNIPVADILVKENVKGAIKRSGENVYSWNSGDGTSSVATDFVLYVEEMNIDRDSSTVEVVEGDMILDKVEARTNTGALHITIKRESTTPSTLKVSGTTVSLNRVLAQGDYELRATGIVNANYSGESKLKHATFSKDYYVAYPNYVRIVTPAPSGATIAKVSVTIGGTTLTIGETTTEMDVEPFIEGGYTMVPARWIAIALGLKESDISFDPNTKTCTILANNRIAQLTAGSNILKLNGSEVPFAGPSAMIRNNRLFVPFRVLGEQVMGVVVGWDEPTRTATFNADV